MSKRPVYLLSPSPKENTISLPMIGFERIADKIDFSDCDTLMFTSKQAVVTADEIDPGWKRFSSIAIGPATKKQIEKLGGKVIFHPDNFYGKELAKSISEFFKDRKILYLRPEKITFDSKGYLEKNGIKLSEQIIYKTKCIEYDRNKQPPEGSIIIFTSPSTIDCFLKNFDWLPGYTAVVIGKTTKIHLPDGCSYAVADKPSIESCIKKAMEIQS